MANTAYDQFKVHEGKRYTGMKIGRGHRWKYDAGDWTEKKVTPDKWEFQYSVVKRRKGRAPEGSGAPVGTAYNWYILGRQIVTKLDANSYTTELAGVKYKLAHKRADKTSWSASDRAQRRRLVQILREVIDDLQREDVSPARSAEETPSTHDTSGKEQMARSNSRARSASSRRTATAPPARGAHRRHRTSTRPLRKRTTSIRSRR
jgi:hypothetical protein